jgi:spermidine synthase
MPSDDLDVLAYEQSVIGMICLRQRPLPSDPETRVTEITLDHLFLMSDRVTASERALAASGLARHPGTDLDVVVGGLGLGCTAREVLRSERVARLEVVELLPQIIGWHDEGLVPLAAELRADPRFQVRQADLYAWLAAPPAPDERLHDLILIDVDNSPHERFAEVSRGFYTPEGLARAKAHLAPGGVLGVWSCHDSPPFEDALRRSFAHVEVEDVEFENDVLGGIEINWLFFARG